MDVMFSSYLVTEQGLVRRYARWGFGMFRKRAPAPKLGQTPLRRLPRLTRSFIGTVRYHPSSV